VPETIQKNFEKAIIGCQFLQDQWGRWGGSRNLFQRDDCRSQVFKTWRVATIGHDGAYQALHTHTGELIIEGRRAAHLSLPLAARSIADKNDTASQTNRTGDAGDLFRLVGTCRCSAIFGLPCPKGAKADFLQRTFKTVDRG
jgi:hypothetical protein